MQPILSTSMSTVRAQLPAMNTCHAQFGLLED